MSHNIETNYISPEKKESENSFTIEVIEPTMEREFNQLMQYVRKIPFYHEHGYTITLPDLEEFQELFNNPERMPKIDVTLLKHLFKTNEYEESFYQNGLKQISEISQNFDQIFNELKILNDTWDFKMFPKYVVELTKYGPGGSYRWDVGGVIMKTSAEGFTKTDPQNTLAHELVHIGIEESMVKKFKLNHLEKERLVDLICFHLFKKQLPSYMFQKIGDKNLDSYVTEDSLPHLPLALKKYIEEFPRV